MLQISNLPLEDIMFIQGCNKIAKDKITEDDLTPYNNNMFDSIWDNEE